MRTMKHNGLIWLLMIICQLSIVNFAFGDAKPVKYKTLLSEAKTAIKNSKNQAKAEQNLLAIVNREDIDSHRRAEIYFTAEELERSLNAAENMKMYLKQSYDTTKFFSTILKMYEYLLICDSVESQPDEKGAVKYKYRKKGQEILYSYRSNLLNGGKFLLVRDKYADAFQYFDMYIRSSQSNILKADTLISGDTLLPRVAYWATIAAYNANQPRQALRHIDEAIGGADRELRVSLQEYKVRCYEALKDEEKWVDNLVVGTQLYPEHDYFYLHLIDVFMQEKLYDDGLALCDSMLQKVGEKDIYWYGKSQMYLALQQYDETIETADKAIQHDSLYTDAYYNKGIAYLSKAVLFAETMCNDIRNPQCRKDRETLKGLYRSAQGPMEQVRALSPADSKRWASPLYRIYLNLNMGKEFAEMEKILNAQ